MKKILFALIGSILLFSVNAYGNSDEDTYTEKQLKQIEEAKEYLKNADMEYPTLKYAEFACIAGDVGMLKKMESHGFKQWNKPILITQSIRFRRIDCFKFIISKIVSINAEGDIFLNEAAKKGQLEMCKLLVAKGADAKKAIQAMMVAARKGYWEICQLLLSNGADVNAKGADDWTALMFAASYGHFELCKFFVSNGADINAKSAQDYSALMLAAQNGHLELCKFLIANGAEINEKNNRKSQFQKFWLLHVDNLFCRVKTIF